MDASFADREDKQSTIGYVTHWCGGPLHWKTKKSGTVALSTTEAEYIGESFCAREIVYARQLLDSFGITQTGPAIVYGDNEAALKLASIPGISELSKHIQIKYHFVRECQENRALELHHVGTLNNVADILTKGITMKDKFARLRMLVGMTTPSQMLRFTRDRSYAWLLPTKQPTEPISRRQFVTVPGPGFKKTFIQPINEYLADKRLAQVKPIAECKTLHVDKVDVNCVWTAPSGFDAWTHPRAEWL